MAELSNFDKWAAGYFSWVEPLPTPDEMQIARDAYEAGRRNAAKVWTEADQAAWMALPEEERRRRNHEEAARGVTVASEHQAVRGVFAGESMAKAAEGWAAWCERRHLSSLSEFLIDVSRALGVTPTGEAQRLAWEACRLLCAAAVVQENPDKVVCPPAFVVAVRAAMLALRNAGVKAWPPAGQWEHECPQSTGKVLLRDGQTCTNCGATSGVDLPLKENDRG